MRIVQLGSAIVGVIALVMITAATSSPAPGRLLPDRILASVRGADPKHQGEGIWSCDEAQANAQGSQYLSMDQCKAVTVQPFPPGLYCLNCPDDPSFGRNTNGEGGNIYYVGQEQCSGRVETTTCTKSMAGNYGVCGVNWSFTGYDCAATFHQWKDQ